jgi:uncharacterized protein (TIGR03435 family)
MMRTTIAGLMVVSAAAWAQAPVQFEVATIKPVDAIVAGSGQRVNVGVHVNGQQFLASALSLKEYLATAHNKRLYQIEGPDWIASDRFDLSAKIPEGVKLDNDAMMTMLRGLLTERFQVKSHTTQKEFAVYALVQLKDGIKAVESPLDPVDEKGVTVGGSGGATGTVISLGRGSTLTVGGNRIEGKKYSMVVLADTLARFVDKPVVDQTGLTSTYDITLDLSPEDFQALMIRSAIAAGITLPPQALKLLDTASGDSLHEALSKVGLKLESKKVPLDVLVIDSLNHAPSEN